MSFNFSATPSSGNPTSSSSGPHLSIDSGWDNLFNDEDEEREDNIEAEYLSTKDCIILLIDAQPLMFQKNERDEIPFHNAIKCAIATLTDKIISSENDLLGICFYGTKSKKNPNEFDNLYVFSELESPDPHKILELENFLKDEKGPGAIGNVDKEFPLADALWTCSSLFSMCSVKVGHKRIFLFTNQDNPNNSDPQLRNRSIQRAKDLSELSIDIELFSMNRIGHKFDPSLFYQDLISVPGDEDFAVRDLEASSKFEELITKVRRKEYKKRAITAFSLRIGEDIEIAVRLYNLLQATKKSSFVWLDGKTNKPLQVMTKYICEDTGSLLLPTQIKFGYPYGGERIIFEKEEIATIKMMDKQGLSIMGFKPRSSLKVYQNLRSSSFIYPDERQIKGSSVAFAALLDRMLALDKIAICRLTPRANTAPRFVALYPQAEEFDDDGTQKTPSGFHIIYLPFADDIRDLTIESFPKAETEQIVKAKKLVKTLRIKFDSRNFENPSLQKHYAALQALALEREQVEEVRDYVMPDEEGFQKYSNVIEDFRKIAFPENYDPMVYVSKKTSGTKRKYDGDKTSLEEADIMELMSSGAIERYTIPELKEFMKNHDVKYTSKDKKENLIQKLKEHFGYSDGMFDDEKKAEIKPVLKKQNSNISNSNSSKKAVASESDEEEEEEALHKKKKAHFESVSTKNSISNKKMQTSDDEDEVPKKIVDNRPMCKYGSGCYRKNPQHLAEFRHPVKGEESLDD